MKKLRSDFLSSEFVEWEGVMKKNIFRDLGLTLLSVLLVISLTACGGGGGGGGGGTPSDTSAPITTAVPGGGTYGSIQYVTLTANESATIYYSLDGFDPSVGGANTISGTSPITNVEITATTLKFFAVDSASNKEAVKSETYIIDLDAPNISFNALTPGPFGLLTSATISWQSDEDGDYTIELGGTGSVGTGEELATGSVTANTAVTQQIKGTQLSFDAPTPLWIYLTDQVGHTGSSSLSLSMNPFVPILIGGELWDIEILPGGEKVYVANTSNDNVAVIDTDPLSPSYNNVINNVSVGIRPSGIAVTPDGEKVYVSNQNSNSISVISTSTDTVIDTILDSALKIPLGIDITPDGTRAYVTTWNGWVSVLDTDSSSSTYHQVVANIIMNPLFLGGRIGIAPDGMKAVVNWFGMISHGVDVIDVDPLSPSYNIPIGTIVPVTSDPSGSVDFSLGSDFAYITSSYCGLCKVDLNTYDILISYSGPFLGGISLTTDGLTLLHSDRNDTELYLFNASDLTLIDSVDFGTNLGKDISITPDGTRAYILRDTLSSNSEVVMVPLL